MRLEDLGLIGNCQFSALIERTGSVVWLCLPRFDSEPIFGKLLDEKNGGEFFIGAIDHSAGVQHYLPNTNVLETNFITPEGKFRILDFAPRFHQFDRAFRPTQLMRIVEPLEGTPRIQVHIDPRLGWSKDKPPQLQGSHHVRFDGFASQLRLTTNIPISYLNGQPFALTQRSYFALTWGAPIEEPLPPLCERFLNETVQYWQRWVKLCNVPPLYQQEVIRSALVLKLHCFEDTGAIVAGMTTSIPESPKSGRTWDYRYCWLRDAYYALSAFRLLGHFEERESFVQYLINVASSSHDLELSPLYRIDATTNLKEIILENWVGFNGDGPVRIGNDASRQRQNDLFGEMVLALCPIFFDDRFSEERSPQTFQLLEQLTRKAIQVAGTPDSGIWEFRQNLQKQTFSSLMCWAATDRMTKISKQKHPKMAAEFQKASESIFNEILLNAWNPNKESFVSYYGGENLDASLLQMPSLHFLPENDPRLRSTIDKIWKELGRGNWIYRYRADDGFGTPTVAFALCTFWLIEALANTGREKEAREILDQTLKALSPLGLLSEDYDIENQRLLGNFPQAYSHVGLIHAAFSVSPRWPDVL